VEVDPDLPAFAALRGAHAQEFDVPPELLGAPYGSDMRLLVHEAETPAILYGPGDIRQAHATDEWIAVDEIVQAARVVTAAPARSSSLPRSVAPGHREAGAAIPCPPCSLDHRSTR